METAVAAYQALVFRTNESEDGTICQACGLDVGQRYGPIGKGYIEAHHLQPISTLQEGIAVTYNVSSDFAVLCANYHRTIHRTDDPGDVASFVNLSAIPTNALDAHQISR